MSQATAEVESREIAEFSPQASTAVGLVDRETHPAEFGDLLPQILRVALGRLADHAHHFGVAVGVKLVSSRFELAAQVAEVVDLTVVGDDDLTQLVRALPVDLFQLTLAERLTEYRDSLTATDNQH